MAPFLMSSDNGASAIVVGMRLLEGGASALDVRFNTNHLRAGVLMHSNLISSDGATCITIISQRQMPRC